MSKKVKFVSLLLVVFSLFSFSACRLIYSDDVVTLAEYLKYFDKPEDIVINKLERVEFENTTVYYMLWSEYQLESDEVELLIVYDHESYKVKNCFMLDMEYGAHPDIKALWESRATKANSSYTYSAEEIKTLVSDVADYCDKWIDDEERKIS